MNVMNETHQKRHCVWLLRVFLDVVHAGYERLLNILHVADFLEISKSLRLALKCKPCEDDIPLVTVNLVNIRTHRSTERDERAVPESRSSCSA